MMHATFCPAGDDPDATERSSIRPYRLAPSSHGRDLGQLPSQIAPMQRVCELYDGAVRALGAGSC